MLEPKKDHPIDQVIEEIGNEIRNCFSDRNLVALSKQEYRTLISENTHLQNRLNDVLKENRDLKRKNAALSNLDECHFEVLEFAKIMDWKLRINSYKGTWKDCDLTYLKRRLTQEMGEFQRALSRHRDNPDGLLSKQDVLHEAGDVANFLMMIVDVIGALSPQSQGGE